MHHLQASTLRLQVKFHEGQFVLQGGTALPEIREGALAELVIPGRAIVDEALRSQLAAERPAAFLPKHTVLYARVKAETIKAELIPFRVKRFIGPKEDCFVRFRLENDLHLIVSASSHSYLGDCPCSIAALDDNAESINEAYTKISVAFEPRRRSHTGNVFLCVYADEPHGEGVRVLQKLREKTEATPSFLPEHESSLFG